MGLSSGVGQRRVLLVDDQRLMLEAMRVFVSAAPDFTVVGEAVDGAVAVQQVRALRPDIVLMDLQMPRMDGVAATRMILSEHSHIKVIAVTTFHSQEYVIPALKAGASGYLLKDSAPEDIINGIRAVVAGEFVISPRVTDVLVRSVREDLNPSIAARSTPEDFGLSPREMDVIGLLCQGSSNREISQHLHLAEPTVKSHISRIMQKLDVRDRVQIVITAYRSGLVDI